VALILPNLQDAPAFDAMAVRDAADYQTLAAASRNTGVLSGMQITQDTGTDLKIAAASGSVRILGQVFSYTGTGSPFTVPTVSPGGDRRDAVIYRAGSGVEILEGTPNTTPNWDASSDTDPPVKPELVEATDCLLAEIYTTPTTTEIVAANLVDKTVQLFVPGARGTPDSATTALTASTLVMVPGTKIAIPTGSLQVGSRFRFMVGIQKTAAGTATWALTVRFGTNGTTADAAIASWTSGTNTALLDQGVLMVEVVITALGSGTAATAQCTAFWSHGGTTATGLGSIACAPTTTTGFNSTATAPFIHVDVTAGAAAVMTGWGSAEQLA
jgi:hypothetical protein